MTKIRELRMLREFSQKEFAKRIGVPANTLCQWETGKREPDYEMLKRIADILNVSTDYLLDREEAPSPFSSASNIGEQLKYFRAERGLTQKELSEKLLISPSTIGMYEQNRREPDYETLKKIANILQVSTDMLLGLEEKEKPAASDELLLDPQNREFLQLYSMLTPEERQFVMAAIKGILSKR